MAAIWVHSGIVELHSNVDFLVLSESELEVFSGHVVVDDFQVVVSVVVVEIGDLNILESVDKVLVLHPEDTVIQVRSELRDLGFRCCSPVFGISVAPTARVLVDSPGVSQLNELVGHISISVRQLISA